MNKVIDRTISVLNLACKYISKVRLKCMQC